MPGAVLDESLDRLARCVATTRAERVIVVGDLLHTKTATTPEVIERVAAWRAELAAEIGIVPGNHDRDIADIAARWHLRLYPAELYDGPFRIVHEPDAGTADHYTWAGHLHPAVALSAGGDSVRLPCFRVGTKLAVLPAFSVFTGRGGVTTAPDDRLYAVTPERVFPVPAPRARGR
ncbi:MAG: metallophosphatase [Planctomycetota bacterium]|nr:metallophosphatase [Planctomycetota bacterium]